MRQLHRSFLRYFCLLVALLLPGVACAQTYSLLGNPSSRSAFSYIFDITVGYTFTPRVQMQVIGVRSYGGDGVSIWTSDGTRLINEPVSGPGFTWTTNRLDTPITLSPNTTYYITDHLPGNTFLATAYGSDWPATFHDGILGQSIYFSGFDAFPTIPFMPNGDTNQGVFVDLNYIVVPEPNFMPVLALGLFVLAASRKSAAM